VDSRPLADPAAAAVPAVRIRALVKNFGDHQILRGIDLDVSRGEKLVVIGPSGSGKTTLLRVLMTLEIPDDGYVEIGGRLLGRRRENGRVVEDKSKELRAARSRVGMVFQHFNLFPHMTVLQNICESPIHSQGLRRTEAEGRAHGLLRQVGLADKAQQYPAELSGGQQQRVAIARALALRPEIMLFDEVTSALDPELVGEVLAIVRLLAQETNMTLIIVTHEMGFARSVADRVVFMDLGCIVEQGVPGELFTAPKHERTKTFLRAILER
jgi:polar amino acid transport system ATP-binding protein